MKKTLYIITHIFIAFFLLILIASFFGMIHGSLEMLPTEEQHEKARIAYGALAFVSVLIVVVLLKIRS